MKMSREVEREIEREYEEKCNQQQQMKYNKNVIIFIYMFVYFSRLSGIISSMLLDVIDCKCEYHLVCVMQAE